MTSKQPIYVHGHHESVVKSHSRRTLENSAPFVIPAIEPHHHILDVGCGPGTITTGLARLASKGHVIGCDAVQDVLDQAQRNATDQGLTNLSFQKADAYALPFNDATFDITFCHQVLQHVRDPAAVLKEMHRITKPGGVVAAREADYKSFAWWPEIPGIDDWAHLYQKVHKSSNAEPNAGRYLPQWAKEAGFDRSAVIFTWDVWNYQDEEAKAFGTGWVDRARLSNYATLAKKEGLATEAELEGISQAWKQWAASDGAFLIIPNGQILCRV